MQFNGLWQSCSCFLLIYCITFYYDISFICSVQEMNYFLPQFASRAQFMIKWQKKNSKLITDKTMQGNNILWMMNGFLIRLMTNTCAKIISYKLHNKSNELFLFTRIHRNRFSALQKMAFPFHSFLIYLVSLSLFHHISSFLPRLHSTEFLSVPFAEQWMQKQYINTHFVDFDFGLWPPYAFFG